MEIHVKSEKTKNTSLDALKASREDTKQSMGDFFIDLHNQSKYFDIKHGNVQISNKNAIQEFTNKPIVNSKIDELMYIRISTLLFETYKSDVAEIRKIFGL